MKVTPIKTSIVQPKSLPLTELLDRYVTEFNEKDILVITSKIVSLCEGNVVPANEDAKEALALAESEYYLPAEHSKYGHHFTITQGTLISMAGIDASNTGDYYALWPKNPQKTANEIRAYLRERFTLKHVGVLITDSTSQPLRRGTAGICLAHSGFLALNDYIGRDDLFHHPLKMTQSNISSGLASAAVVCMGEGAEQTPLAVISDVDFVSFQERDPTAEELRGVYMSLEDDLFAPFLMAVPWQKGGHFPKNVS
jgi:putative folate metabolism gamma-glutamate ligase